MAEVPGGYQPDTRSESARRADFDLLRRINRVQRAADDLGTANPANALGIVKMGTLLTNSGTNFVVPSAGPPHAITAPLVFTPLVGRRYRIVLVVGTWTSPSTTSLFAYLWRDGVNSLTGDRYQQWVAGGVGNAVRGDWLINGDGVQHSYDVRIVTGTTGTLSNVASGGLFYIEDIGSNAAPALPIPATPPAWTPVTFLNGWKDHTAGTYVKCGYRKIGDMVQLRGYALPGTTITMFQLPVGFRPPLHVEVPGSGYSNQRIHNSIMVQSGGNVNADTLNGVGFSFEFSVTP